MQPYYTPASPANNGPLALIRKLRDLCKTLVESSNRLTDALIHRQSESCWAIMAEQEKVAGEFHQQLHLWQTLFAGQEDFPPAINAERLQLKRDLALLQDITRQNAALSRGFSGVIRRTMTTVGKVSAKRTMTYNRKGKMATNNRKVIINQIG